MCDVSLDVGHVLVDCTTEQDLAPAEDYNCERRVLGSKHSLKEATAADQSAACFACVS